MLGMFYVNAIPATILFDSGATHSFMSARYANTNEIPLLNMRKPMIVITPKGHVEANHMAKGYSIARVNQVTADATPDGADIALGMFYINAIPATILFDSGATHSFMSA